jgi:membrane associated rhomboid family serine protease
MVRAIHGDYHALPILRTSCVLILIIMDVSFYNDDFDEVKEKKIFNYSLFFPLLFVIVLWIVKLLELYFNVSFAEFGVLPRVFKGLRGVVLSPLIHGDFNHLIDNSIPLFFVGFALVYFYRSYSYRIFFLSYFFSGLGTWIIGRNSFHIGASGVIYALASFLFFSGIIRKNNRLIAISLIVIFMYGGLVWGIFPSMQHMSWEGHLSGGLTGWILSIVFRKLEVMKPVYSWEFEDDEDESNEE